LTISAVNKELVPIFARVERFGLTALEIPNADERKPHPIAVEELGLEGEPF
jgi:hypothetical protein